MRKMFGEIKMVSLLKLQKSVLWSLSAALHMKTPLLQMARMWEQLKKCRESWICTQEMSVTLQGTLCYSGEEDINMIYQSLSGTNLQILEMRRKMQLLLNCTEAAPSFARVYFHRLAGSRHSVQPAEGICLIIHGNCCTCSGPLGTIMMCDLTNSSQHSNQIQWQHL